MWKRRGFTLIELLVVIAILGMLIAIVLSSLRLARDKGKRMVCLSNLRNLTFAWTLYANDNDGYMCSPCPRWYGEDQECSWIFWDTSWPWPRNWTTDQWEESMTQGALWEYNDKGMGIYRCPAGLLNERITYSGFASMGWRECLNRPIDGECYERVQEIPSPGKRAVFIDEGMLTPNFYGVYYNIEAWFDQPPGRHYLGTTLSFADTHVEYWEWKDYRTRKICQLSWDDFAVQWKKKPCLDNNDLFKMKIAAWGGWEESE